MSAFDSGLATLMTGTDFMDDGSVGGLETARLHKLRIERMLAFSVACLFVAGVSAISTRSHTAERATLAAGEENSAAVTVSPIPTTSTMLDRSAVDRLVTRIVTASKDIDRAKAQIASSTSQLVGALSQWDNSASQYESAARELRGGTVAAVPAAVASATADMLERSAASWRTSAACFRTIIAAGPSARQDPSACNGRGEDPMMLAVRAAFELAEYTTTGLTGLVALVSAP